VSTAIQARPQQEAARKSAYPSDCNVIAITLSVYRIEAPRTTAHGVPVRTVRCLRRDGLNGGRTSFYDVWLWKDLVEAADHLRPGMNITVTGKLVGVDAYTDSSGKPAATVIISAAGLAPTAPLRQDSLRHAY